MPPFAILDRVILATKRWPNFVYSAFTRRPKRTRVRAKL